MKELTFYKIGLGVFAVWQAYYTYWWFAIHNQIKKMII